MPVPSFPGIKAILSCANGFETMLRASSRISMPTNGIPFAFKIVLVSCKFLVRSISTSIALLLTKSSILLCAAPTIITLNLNDSAVAVKS